MTESNWLPIVAAARAGDEAAAEAIFQRYLSKLIALAGRHLSPKIAHRVDAEDIVQSAMRTFFVRLRGGQFDFSESADLWRLLSTITLRKLHRQVKYHFAESRDAGRETSRDARDIRLGDFEPVDPEPSVDEVVGVCDELQELMQRLTPAQRTMLELRLQGYTFREIAAETGHAEYAARRLVNRVKGMLERRAEEMARYDEQRGS